MNFIGVKDYWINVDQVTYIVERVEATLGRILVFGLVGGQTLKIYGLTNKDIDEILEKTAFAITRR